MTRSKKNKGGQQNGEGAAEAQPQQQQQPAAAGAPQQQGGSDKKKEGGKRNDACCVFVGNVAFTTTWQKLKDVMRKAGDIDLVELVVDSSHKPKGSALVSFKNEADAKTAVATLNGTLVDGREILVRAYEKGARPLVIYGNYTREQLNRVLPKEKGQQGGQQGGQQQPPQQQHHQQQHHHHHQHQQQHLPGGDRMSLRPQQGGRQEWRVNDGGDFNRRNKDTFGDEAVGYRGAQGNGMPAAHGMPHHHHHHHHHHHGGAVPLPASQAGVDRKKLFVSNLPFSCTWKLLKDTFSQIGKVLRADIIMDDRGRSRGMGTVVFASTEEALKAIEEFDGIEMEGRPMGVRLDRDYLAPH
eukprot:CAMPEP_0174836690 /NCGR_PEP_ID=MMETSP1114-20130205/6233_1 /TAXON_ID=312471 /ORGANISM="Neobodo designis, Strain CCAP 1951/1" /LENGTH=353 /DNA_ID=CAMNT_0016070697 /DNA_START=74 /DNA_END=1135 /DNA_ORIENTATION=-